MKRLIIPLFLALVACEQTEAETVAFGSLDDAFFKREIAIETKSGKKHDFDVYVAATREQQTRGLMFVGSMPNDAGMLFIYSRSDYLSMWMKNTYIPLDIVFAKRDGTVTKVISDTTPHSLKSLSSDQRVSYVLELNAGIAERLGIGPGSRLILD